MNDPSLCVATIHGRNTSGRHGGPRYRREIAMDRVNALLGERAAAYRAAAADPCAIPLASCIMPTCNRPEFAVLALSRFREQDYPRKELVVVDDGSESIEAVVRAEANPDIRYRRLEPRGASVGEKRNIACDDTLGEFICMWDDDDWYAPNRLSLQVTPLLYDQADLTGLRCDCLLCLPSGAAWAVTDSVHQRMFESDVTGGTIAFHRRLLQWVRFPPINLAEDAAFIRMARARGYRLQRIAGHEAFAYVRHMHNTWQFEPGRSFDPNGWRRGAPPAAMSSETLEQYRRACTAWLQRRRSAG
jgi:glycosyltransferase involved in cell wall biosynthesis